MLFGRWIEYHMCITINSFDVNVFIKVQYIHLRLDIRQLFMFELMTS